MLRKGRHMPRMPAVVGCIRGDSAARFFFLAMDMVAGRKVTLGKVKLLETLACIPYRARENRQYARIIQLCRKRELVQRACMIKTWGRKAHDNEYRRLPVVNEKIKEDCVKDPWYLFPLIPFLTRSSCEAVRE